MLTLSQRDTIIKNAYWTVLINCDPNDPKYLKERTSRTKIISSFIITASKTIEVDVKNKILDGLNEECIRLYSKKFLECKDQQKYEVAYTLLQNYLTATNLSEIYNALVQDKPTRYCEGCKKFSSGVKC